MNLQKYYPIFNALQKQSYKKINRPLISDKLACWFSVEHKLCEKSIDIAIAKINYNKYY